MYPRLRRYVKGSTFRFLFVAAGLGRAKARVTPAGRARGPARLIYRLKLGNVLSCSHIFRHAPWGSSWRVVSGGVLISWASGVI